MVDNGSFYVLAGTVAAAMWIATVILLQQTREALKGVPRALGPIRDTPKMVWVWSSTITTLTATLFQTVIFWSLLSLINQPDHTLLRVAAIIATAVLTRDLLAVRLLWNGVIENATGDLAETKSRIKRATPVWSIRLVFGMLYLGYAMTAVAPQDLLIVVFEVLCLWFAVGLAIVAITALASTESQSV